MGVWKPGFGWSVSTVKGHVNINHNGAMNGCLANMSRFVDDELTVIVLINQSGLADTPRIATGVVRLYLPAIRPNGPPEPPAPVNLDAKAVAAYTGRYEYFNNYMLTITDGNGKLLGQLSGRASDDYLPLSPTSFWQAEEGTQVTVMNNGAGEVTGLLVRHDEGWEHTAPRIGPLIHSLTPQPDSNPMLTRKIELALKAMGQGPKAVQDAQRIASGRKKDFASPITEFVAMRSLIFIAAQDVSGRKIERHDEKVSRILYYKLVSEDIMRYVLVYMTADDLISDTDVVDD